MRATIVLLVFALVCPQKAFTARCTVAKHLGYSGTYPALDLNFPCKYNFVDAQCADYTVSIVLGNVYRDPFFIVDTAWIRVERGDDFWEGRTSNNITFEFFNGNAKEPFVKEGGNLKTSDLFQTETYTKHAGEASYRFFKARSTDQYGYIAVEFWPFHESLPERGTILSFNCYSYKFYYPSALPGPICGTVSYDGTEIHAEADRLGFSENGMYDLVARDKTFCYEVFTDSTIDQSPDKTCGAVVNTMNNVCPNDAKRVEAINLCYGILYNKQYRGCVYHNAEKASSELIDVFYQCVELVCSGFTNQTACQALGDYIDTCPNSPGLTNKVQECYHRQ